MKTKTPITKPYSPMASTLFDQFKNLDTQISELSEIERIRVRNAMAAHLTAAIAREFGGL